MLSKNISNPSSWPEARREPFLLVANIQYLYLAFFSMIISVLVYVFHTLKVLSSEFVMRLFVTGSNNKLDTLFLCPKIVECSHATSFVYFQSLILRSSEPDAIILVEGWKAAQLQPLSWPYNILIH